MNPSHRHTALATAILATALAPVVLSGAGCDTPDATCPDGTHARGGACVGDAAPGTNDAAVTDAGDLDAGGDPHADAGLDGGREDGGPDAPAASFTRPGPATQLAEAPREEGGFLVSVGTDRLRREAWRADGLGEMVLLEGSRENLVADVDDMTADAWSDGQVAGVSRSAITAPDGSVAYEVTFQARENSRFLQGIPASALADDTAYNLSVWARAKSGTAAVRLGVPLKHGGVGLGGDHRLDTRWTRIDQTADVGQGDGTPFLRIQNGSDGEARTVVFALCNLTEGAHPTSTIPSQSRRAADRLEVASLPAAMNEGAWSFVLAPSSAHDESPPGSRQQLFHVDGENFIGLSSNGVEQFLQLKGGDVTITTDALSFERGQRIRVTLDPTVGTLSVSGASGGDGIYGASPWSWPDEQPVAAGAGANRDGGNPYFGFLSEPRATGSDEVLMRYPD